MCRVRTCPTTEPLVGAFRGCTPVSALQPNVQAKVGVRQDPPQQKLRAEIPYLLERKNERSRERNRRATAKKQRNPRRRLCSPLHPTRTHPVIGLIARAAGALISGLRNGRKSSASRKHARTRARQGGRLLGAASFIAQRYRTVDQVAERTRV